MKLVSLAFLFIIFLASTALVSNISHEGQIMRRERVTNSLLPVLASDNHDFPVLSAQGVIAKDEDSGAILYEKNSDQTLLPASTTKIVTALTAMDYYKPDDVLTVHDPKIEGQKMGLLKGEQMTFNNLLNALLIFSANDAAQVMAQNYPGGYDSFIEAMSQKAKAINLTNTHFVNPIGLDEDGQVSTAHDLVLASEVAMRNEKFAKIVGTKNINVSDVTGKFNYQLKNVNELLGTVDGVVGVKTGWTEGARENLVTYIKRGDKKVIIALLGSQDRFGETKELINWIFESYVWKNPDEVITYHSTHR